MAAVIFWMLFTTPSLASEPERCLPPLIAGSVREHQRVRFVLREMLSGMHPMRREYLCELTSLHLVGRGESLPDVKGAIIRTHIRGAEGDLLNEKRRRVFENLVSSKMAGYVPRGEMARVGQRLRVMIGVENLDDSRVWDDNGRRTLGILIHEVGHAVFYMEIHMRGKLESMSDEEYEARSEYFAQFTEAWFNRRRFKRDRIHIGSAWIKKHQPLNAALLEEIYGPARTIGGYTDEVAED